MRQPKVLGCVWWFLLFLCLFKGSGHIYVHSAFILAEVVCRSCPVKFKRVAVCHAMSYMRPADLQLQRKLLSLATAPALDPPPAAPRLRRPQSIKTLYDRPVQCAGRAWIVGRFGL